MRIFSHIKKIAVLVFISNWCFGMMRRIPMLATQAVVVTASSRLATQCLNSARPDYERLYNETVRAQQRSQRNYVKGFATGASTAWGLSQLVKNKQHIKPEIEREKSDE